MMTVCTASYAVHTRRLVTSYLRSHPGAQVTVYCDAPEKVDRALAGFACRVIELPAIQALGVKRAKFEAYKLSAGQGSFLYLDSDVIVLAPLDGLADGKQLVACADDLSECDFIANRSFPWADDPGLEAKVYVNSGVMFIPAALFDFLDELHVYALNDATWVRYTIEGKLYDNHFLCAFLNKKEVPLRLVDALAYNWQGMRRGEEVLAQEEDGHLVNAPTSTQLHLLHFAGIRDIDGFLLGLSPAALRVVANAACERPLDVLDLFHGHSPSHALPGDVPREIARALVMAERQVQGACPNDPSAYLPNSASFLSLALAEKPSDVLWNGFPCGGSYLNPQEYDFLRDVVRNNGIATVLEIGGGFSSVLLNQHAQKVLSIEASDGPWLDAALARGCDVEHIPFDPVERRFDEATLAAAIARRGLTTPDLLFIDSPVGTVSRRGVFSQLQRIIRARFIAFHDARRDADLVFEAMGVGYLLHSYLPSLRGFVLLAAMPGAQQPKSVPAGGTDEGAYKFSATLVERRTFSTATGGVWRRVLLRNEGQRELRSSGEDAVLLSYHLTNSDGAGLRWDNARTPLPCDLRSGDELVFDVLFEPYEGDAYFHFDLVCEGRYWVSQLGPVDIRRYPMRELVPGIPDPPNLA